MINAFYLMLAVILTFILAYRSYIRKIENIWQIDPERPTPAATRFDGVDFLPAKNWLVLFGHHFSSIAGAGPIIGPVIACYLWGWGPSLLWVVLGSIFLGCIHDFGSLIISVREEGITIGEIASRSISRKAKLILSVFTWLALILVIAVFAYLGAKTLVTQPEIVVPSLGIIPLAVLVGLGLYRFKWPATPVTAAGLVLLAGLIITGKSFPVKLPGDSQTAWIIVLFVYCFFASITPVNILLQPRDYLSSFLLFGGLLVGMTGIAVNQPVMPASNAFIRFDSPVGLLWPMMFITIACGANSGFHCLISSGTTSRQLPNERFAKRIGAGGMLMEGLLAAMVIVIVIGGFSMDAFHAHISGKTDPVTIYGTGFGNITRSFLGPWGMFFALTILNVFILTTLDSATRITRYISEELFRIKNRYLATLIVIVFSAFLALGKDSTNVPLWQKIWPAFGASNQLVAALALLVITSWLLSKDKPVRYALFPALFMLVTSLTALIFQLTAYWKHREYTLIVISLILVLSALVLAGEVIRAFRKKFRERGCRASA